MLDKARDGSWGTISFWNAKSLGDLSMNGTQAKGFGGKTITYMLTVKNISPAAQKFTVTDKIPDGTTFFWGAFYNASTNSIEWNGMVPAYQTRIITFSVKIKPWTPFGTKITNTAILGDDANGDTATQIIRVMR